MKFKGYLTLFLVLIFSFPFMLIINVPPALAIESSQSFENPVKIKSQPHPVLDFRGLNYGPFRAAGPNNLEIITDEMIEEDMEIFQDLNVTDIRTYGVGLGLNQIPKIADSYGIKTATGTWVHPGNTDNYGEIDLAIAQENYSSMLIIGNEVLTTGVFTEAQFRTYIDYAQNNAASTTPIAAAEEWAQFLAHPNISNALDVLLVHAHPVWHDIPLVDAANWTISKFNEVKTSFPTKTVILGETGWPSGPGGDLFNKTAQAYFMEDLLNRSYHENIDVYIFEAFDEQWKAEIKDGQLIGPNWGIMYKSRYGKPAAEVVARYFDGVVNTSPPPNYQPFCTSPADQEVDQGDSASIIWTITDQDNETGYYTLYKNGTVLGVANLEWQKDQPILVGVDTLFPGVFEYKIAFNDGNHEGEDIVIVTVLSTTSATSTPGFVPILAIPGFLVLLGYKKYKERKRRP
ncbi:MAG: hypothetical protein ACFFCZ_24105 [Promethearchaeota archaeon]